MGFSFAPDRASGFDRNTTPRKTGNEDNSRGTHGNIRQLHSGLRGSRVALHCSTQIFWAKAMTAAEVQVFKAGSQLLWLGLLLKQPAGSLIARSGVPAFSVGVLQGIAIAQRFRKDRSHP